MSEPVSPPTPEDNSPWYAGINRYQWLVLIIASAGWAFDIYEGQIFNITRTDMLAEILGPDNTKENVKFYGDVFLGVFLLGGTLGGLLFGSLADQIGRRPVMIITILMYSIFAGLTYFAQNIWHVAILRFLVAMGVGGEWAVAASLVAEVFPRKARAQASGIFHATSVLGTWMAAIAGLVVGTHWRYAYLVGVIPALLIVAVRASVKEPERWEGTSSSETLSKRGSFLDLLGNQRWRGRAIAGLLLAAVGLGTFWAVIVSGQDLTKELVIRQSTEADPDMDDAAIAQVKQDAAAKGKFAYGIVQTAGGGLGLLMFGPICARIGRRKTFILYHLMALALVPAICFLPGSYMEMLILLPIFGFFALGIHAGYAIYFPELFPTHLRATGTSFCFNGGRLLAVPVLLLSGSLKAQYSGNLPSVIAGLGTLFLLGAVIMLFLPETYQEDLPEA